MPVDPPTAGILAASRLFNRAPMAGRYNRPLDLEEPNIPCATLERNIAPCEPSARRTGGSFVASSCFRDKELTALLALFSAPVGPSSDGAGSGICGWLARANLIGSAYDLRLIQEPPEFLQNSSAVQDLQGVLACHRASCEPVSICNSYASRMAPVGHGPRFSLLWQRWA